MPSIVVDLIGIEVKPKGCYQFVECGRNKLLQTQMVMELLILL